MTAKIDFDEENMVFHLHNNYISYLIKVDENKKLLQLYFGEVVSFFGNYKYLVERANRPMSISEKQDDVPYSYEYLKQELPESGSSDYRLASLKVEMSNGDTSMDLRYSGHKIYKGKKKLKDVPFSYVENKNNALSLEVFLRDKYSGLEVICYYTIFENIGMISRSLKLTNYGNSTLDIQKIMSINLDLPDSDYELLQLSGAWGRERYIYVNKLHPGVQGFESSRGHSSHNHNPFLILKKIGTSEEVGECIGLSLIYSGDFTCKVEVDTFDTIRAQIGLNPETFSWKLQVGEIFQSPEGVISFSKKGLTTLSQTFHNFINNNIIRGYWKNRVRPVLLNNWEATYFDFDEKKLIDIAKRGKKIGAELFVLDDGWFGNRNDDQSSLGDWWVNEKKFPNGLSVFVKRIKTLGLNFGIWIEPEMVSPNSHLIKMHPEWVFRNPNKNPKLGRNQLVLNFGKPEVVDYIFESLCKVFDRIQLDYIKWDMNRSICESFDESLSNDQQKESRHRYILGVYKLHELLLARYPKILIESCASGGGRFDLGMLCYASQTWTSDCTDAIERLKIQYGTSMAYPLSSMGAHVSVSPNHQNNRLLPLKTRLETAYFGNLGIELDPQKITPEEMIELRDGINFYKKNRELFQFGKFYRLLSPFENNYTAWMVVSKDQTKVVVGVYKVLNEVNWSFKRLKLTGLLPDKLYKATLSNKSPFDSFVYTGDELMKVGLSISDASAGQFLSKIGYEESRDFESFLILLEARDRKSFINNRKIT